MKKRALILFIALIFLTITSVSAVNQTDVIEDDLSAENTFSADMSQEIINDTDIQTNTKSDENSTVIADNAVKFTLNSSETNKSTSSNEVAKLSIDDDLETYTVNCSSQSNEYAVSENSTDVLTTTSTSKIKASDYTAYVGVTNKFTVKLTADGVPLSDREIIFKINDKTYTAKTNTKGKASININEAKGSYKLTYYYAGEENISSTSGSVKIKVKKGMQTKITKYSSKIYRNKKAAYFKIKLTDARGNVLKSKKVRFKFNGKKYTKKTNSKGIAKVKIKLKTGSYKVKVSFSKTSVYKKAAKTFKIKVKPKQARNNGMWLFGRDMKSVNLAKLQKYGFKQVFLNFKALDLYGKSKVEKWVKKAKKYGVKVHLWMQVFYSGGSWQNPVKNGKINTNLINTKVKEAKKYAKIKGIAGVHFDYVRYPGNAYQYKNAVKAVNTFIKKATKTVHKVKKSLIVSAAVMPEPSSMKKYYAQDIKTMGKYLDVIVPMVYKCNYNAGKKWIKYVTKTFVKQSKKAKIWTGLQSYKSDSKATKLSAKELMKDADAAALAGARGIILFRYGLFNYINFKNV